MSANNSYVPQKQNELVVKPTRFPKAEIEYFFRNTNITGYNVGSFIPPTIRMWLGKNYPNTNFVKLDSEDRILYTFRGWNEAPTSVHQKCPDWETTVQVLPDEPKFPKADEAAFYKNMDKYIEFSTDPNTLAYPVDILPESMKIWVQTNYPETTYVNLGHMHDYSKNRMVFIMWGWNQKPINFNDKCNPDWRTPYETVNDTPTLAPTHAVSQDPVQAQLTALTEAITNLTKLVAEKL
jgi:hypothetical protein